TTWMYPVEAQQVNRIDYIYTKGAKLQTTASETYNQHHGEMLDFQGKQFFYGSDHGFVLSTFKIK
ncbi:MAG: endonuclease/exonuclease/phosphatase family protein, partial [Rikenellaceae bacterium]